MVPCAIERLGGFGRSFHLLRQLQRHRPELIDGQRLSESEEVVHKGLRRLRRVFGLLQGCTRIGASRGRQGVDVADEGVDQHGVLG
ncbi:MAG: hypothetical protein JF606_24535 [Burkholderiales bacterium]|nr:hypothetical protein [Burkholderiales bacterium]